MKTTIIMNRAHAMTRAIRAEYPAADYRATLAAALRIAWADAQNNPRAEWASMDGNEQFALLRAAVCNGMNRDRAECDRMGNYRPNYFKWIACDDDILCTVNEAFCRMGKAFENAENAIADGKRDSMPTLRAIAANAARSAARYIAQAEMRHASALRIESMTDADGKEYLREYIKDSQSTAEPIAPSPYVAYAIKDSIERACKDATDKRIVAMLAHGLTQQEMSEVLNIAHQNVSKRVRNIRDRYRAQDAAAAE